MTTMYRFLKPEEILREGDEVEFKGRWIAAPESLLGEKCESFFARRPVLQEAMDNAPAMNPQPIISAVCSEFEVTEADLKSKSRLDHIVTPRFLVIVLGIQAGAAPEVATGWVNRSRDLIYHAKEAVQNRIDTEPAFASRVARVKEQLRGRKNATP